MALRLLTPALPLVAALAMTAPAGAANTQDSKAAVHGEQLFATTCGFCHAKGGRKAGKGPKLAGTSRSDEFLTHRIKNGKQGRMPAFGGAFSDEEIKAIVAYIHSLEP